MKNLPSGLLLSASLLLLWGCANHSPVRSAPAANTASTRSSGDGKVVRQTSHPEQSSLRGPIVVFEGMCDASGAVPLSSRLMAVADDEDNRIRIYDAERGGPPLSVLDLPIESTLGNKKGQEADLEAATVLGQRAYFIGSHGRSKKGKRKPARLRFFATNVPRSNAPLKMVGSAHDSLLSELSKEPTLRKFRLAEAALRPPQDPAGLNIEGLTATPVGELLIGFRTPVPDGLALLVPIKNPRAVGQGQKLEFGLPLRLDLHGLGVRGLSFWHGRYLILAGANAQAGTSLLFVWDGKSRRPEHVDEVNFDGFNPEGFFTPEDRGNIMVLSDDGNIPIDGTPCKKLKDPSHKRFRGLWLRLTQEAITPRKKST